MSLLFLKHAKHTSWPLHWLYCMPSVFPPFTSMLAQILHKCCFIQCFPDILSLIIPSNTLVSTFIGGCPSSALNKVCESRDIASTDNPALVHGQPLGECVAQSRCSINICWINVRFSTLQIAMIIASIYWSLVKDWGLHMLTFNSLVRYSYYLRVTGDETKIQRNQGHHSSHTTKIKGSQNLDLSSLILEVII